MIFKLCIEWLYASWGRNYNQKVSKHEVKLLLHPATQDITCKGPSNVCKIYCCGQLFWRCRSVQVCLPTKAKESVDLAAYQVIPMTTENNLHANFQP